MDNNTIGDGFLKGCLKMMGCLNKLKGDGSLKGDGGDVCLKIRGA